MRLEALDTDEADVGGCDEDVDVNGVRSECTANTTGHASLKARMICRCLTRCKIGDNSAVAWLNDDDGGCVCGLSSYHSLMDFSQLWRHADLMDGKMPTSRGWWVYVIDEGIVAIRI